MKTRFVVIPWMPGRFLAITLFGHVFCQRPLDKFVTNHERIHVRQQKELLYVPFLIMYVLEWLVLLVKYRDRDTAYRNISFEREAYRNEQDLTYLTRRPRFAFRHHYH